MMPGMIMLWYGSVATIPSGWHHCDGTMGTPDLRSVFVRCAKSDSEHPIPGYVSPGENHMHTFTGDGHSHTIPGGTGLAAGTDFNLETESDPAVGETDYRGVLMPPYHTLCYIMKL